jgi:hypothetical protein
VPVHLPAASAVSEMASKETAITYDQAEGLFA